MVYKFLMFVLRPVFYFLYGRRKYGMDNLPKDGPLIICANHISSFDCVTVALSNKRVMNFVAKKEIFKPGFYTWLFRNLHAIPVDRDATDMKAYKETVKRLKAGEAVLIFAQGTRMHELDTKSAKQGVALFALMSGAVVVPAHISGRYRPFGKLTIRYGEPVTLDEYKGVKVKTEMLGEITEMLMEKVSELGK